MGIKVTTTEGERLLPFASEISKQIDNKLSDYMPLSGGIFSGDIQIPSVDKEFSLVDLRDTFPATESQLGDAVKFVQLDIDSKYSKKDHGHTVATTSTAGFLSAADKTKLNNTSPDIEQFIHSAKKDNTVNIDALNSAEYCGWYCASGNNKCTGTFPPTYQKALGFYLHVYRTGNAVYAQEFQFGNNSCTTYKRNYSGAAWDDWTTVYLPLSGGTVTGPVVLSTTVDASGTSQTACALRIGDINGLHLAIDGNEILAKSDGSTMSSLTLNNEGGPVVIGNGGLQVRSDITPTSSKTKNIGSSSLQFNQVFAQYFEGTLHGKCKAFYSLPLTTTDDLDNIITEGLYYWADNQPANSPAAYASMLVIRQASDNFLKQIVFRQGSTAMLDSQYTADYIYFRSRITINSSYSWTPWVFIPTNKWTDAHYLKLTGGAVTGSLNVSGAIWANNSKSRINGNNIDLYSDTANISATSLSADVAPNFTVCDKNGEWYSSYRGVQYSSDGAISSHLANRRKVNGAYAERTVAMRLETSGYNTFHPLWGDTDLGVNWGKWRNIYHSGFIHSFKYPVYIHGEDPATAGTKTFNQANNNVSQCSQLNFLIWRNGFKHNMVLPYSEWAQGVRFGMQSIDGTSGGIYISFKRVSDTQIKIESVSSSTGFAITAS